MSYHNVKIYLIINKKNYINNKMNIMNNNKIMNYQKKKYLLYIKVCKLRNKTKINNGFNSIRRKKIIKLLNFKQ